jgi:hypothetical protein
MFPMASHLWPIHPQILPGEILSSWMVRIAQANCFKVHSFYAQYFGRDREIWTRDIDHLAPSWLLTSLAEHTGASPEAIAETTLRSYEGFAFERLTEVGATRWILPLGVYHRVRRSYGQQYCPVCLATDAVPYLRLRWRMAFQMACLSHEVFLRDRCGQCGRALAPHRADILAGRGGSVHLSLRFCAFCRMSLAGDGVSAGRQGVEAQRHLDSVVQAGYGVVGDVPIYSHLYLNGLRILMHGLRKAAGELPSKVAIEALGAQERLRLYAEALALLEAWPTRFIAMCQGMRKPYSQFLPGRVDAPWWIWSVLRANFHSGMASISSSEAEAIFRATKARTGRGGVYAARVLFGRDISGFVEKLRANEDDVDLLMAGLDHAIARARLKDRSLLLRDKIMFLVGRRLNCTLTELVALTIEDVKLAVGNVEPFWDNAQNAGDAQALLAWYVQKVRPEIAPVCRSNSLFVSRSGEGLGVNAASARLTQAVKAAGLRAGFVRWSCWI